MHVALFGGSFNPPHVGHVLNVTWVLSCLEVDAVWVTPTWQHAWGKALAPWDDRLEMLRRAFAPLGERVRISEVERELGGESRTIRVVDRLLEQHPDLVLTLVVGSDILAELERWLEVDRLLSQVRLVVLRRGGHPSDDPRVVGPVIPEVSSTELRRLLDQGELARARELVPRSVVDYIAERGLYRSSGDGRSPQRAFVVGAGRAGVALGLALRAAGWTLTGCWSRSAARAADAGRRLGCPAYDGALDALEPAADLVVLGVVDDAIADVAARLAPRLGAAVLLHTSGSLEASVLLEAGVAAERAGGLHPLVALPDARAVGSLEAAARLREAFVAIEGGAEARAMARAVAEAIGAQPVELRAGGKVAYHAGAALASNFLVTLFAAAERLLRDQAGVPEPQARAMLERLLESTVRNLGALGPVAALTGPVRRGDATTVAAHLAMLAARPELATILDIYRALLPATLELARAAGLAPERAAALWRALDAAEAGGAP